MLDIHGEKLLVRTIRMFLDAQIRNVLVVLGANQEAHRELVKGLAVDVIYNRDWESGIGSSIKAGLQYLFLKYPSAESVIVSVCDQPLLTPETVYNLITRYRETGKPVIASSYADVPGVPVLFHKSYFEKLSRLADDQGAKRIIIQNPADVSLVPFPGGEIDLDTMEDYQRYIRPQGHKPDPATPDQTIP